jgi:DNA-binding transcriptional MerR regulator
MSQKDIYLIKDLSRLSGLSVYTVKYYLKLGLIKEVGRSPETNFRYFDDSTLSDLRKVIGYRKDDISISKIQDLMKDNRP